MSDPAETDPWSHLAAELGVSGSTPTGDNTPSTDDAPSKRRRRRRSRKPSSDSMDAPTLRDVAENETATADEFGTTSSSPDESAPPKKRRRRGLRRRTDDVSGDASRKLEAAAVADANGNDEEAAEPVSVANLPSWQELIDGLYRP